MSESDRDDRGYERPYRNVDMNYVTRRSNGTFSEFDMDSEGMAISIEQGSGYMRECCSTYLHTDVLIEMLREAGYTVLKNE